MLANKQLVNSEKWTTNCNWVLPKIHIGHY